MKRALHALTRVRRHREREAVRRLGAAERSVAEAQRCVADAARPAPSPAPMAAAAVQAARAAELGAWEHTHRLQEAVEQATAERDRAVDEVAGAAIARQQAERLAERRQASERIAAERARQRELDEVAVRGWEGRP